MKSQSHRFQGGEGRPIAMVIPRPSGSISAASSAAIVMRFGWLGMKIAITRTAGTMGETPRTTSDAA